MYVTAVCLTCTTFHILHTKPPKTKHVTCVYTLINKQLSDLILKTWANTPFIQSIVDCKYMRVQQHSRVSDLYSSCNCNGNIGTYFCKYLTQSSRYQKSQTHPSMLHQARYFTKITDTKTNENFSIFLLFFSFQGHKIIWN